MNIDKIIVRGQTYNLLSPATMSDYIETISSVCANPNGYATGAIFLALNSGVQYLYKATADIAYNESIILDTNCEKVLFGDIINELSADLSGYMSEDDYDSDTTVKDAGGIAAFVASALGYYYTSTETDNAITSAIEALDVSDTAVAGSYVTAVSETDGSISATREAADATPTEDSTKLLTSGGAYSEIEAVRGIVSDAYDSSTTYTAGDHFIYNNVAYTVDVACTGVTPPNANYYTASTITDLIEENSSQISDLIAYHDNGALNEISGSTTFSTLENGKTYYMPATDGSIWSGYAKFIHILKFNSNGGVQLAFKVGAKTDVSSEYFAYRISYGDTYSNWCLMTGTNLT